MRPCEALKLHRDRIREIALNHRAENPRTFGSVLRGEHTEDSDIDILDEPSSETTLMDIGAIQFELSEVLGLRLDVATRPALPEKWQKQAIDESMPIA